MQLGLFSSWQYSLDPAINPNVVNMQFPPGMNQSTVQPIGPFQYGVSGLGGAIEAPTMSKIWGVISLLSAAASGYHGVKRNHGSVGWGLTWFALGGLFPIVTPVIAAAQGFGKAKAK